MKNYKIAIIGLGYVGLPLAVEFGKFYSVIGFDIDEKRVKELKIGIDRTRETTSNEILNSTNLKFTNKVEDIKNCNIYIVTVPTPLDQFKSPDLKPLLFATKMIGKFLKKNDIVIYESTVYPGCTEDDCVPILEQESKLKYNLDFFCGYSPERINPGDKINTLKNIKKVTSGSTPEIAEIVDSIYSQIILAGTFKASSIKVAEASKAIENAQRDLNISFINELSLIFDRIGIDTQDVLEAAATKWNFLKYKPGLVGGHCIGVDPYYLAHKAESLGYYPQVILSGRRVNDNMGLFVVNKVIKLMINNGITMKGSNILLLGITFKENCPDTRNSKVLDIYSELKKYDLNVEVYDPYADYKSILLDYNLRLIEDIKTYDAIILAVAHDSFLNIDFSKLKKNKNSIIFDIKGVLDRSIIDGRL
jgi:UDP-N-acetyl-D-galactosamine dehydrogenase